MTPPRTTTWRPRTAPRLFDSVKAQQTHDGFLDELAGAMGFDGS